MEAAAPVPTSRMVFEHAPELPESEKDKLQVADEFEDERDKDKPGEKIQEDIAVAETSGDEPTPDAPKETEKKPELSSAEKEKAEMFAKVGATILEGWREIEIIQRPEISDDMLREEIEKVAGRIGFICEKYNEDKGEAEKISPSDFYDPAINLLSVIENRLLINEVKEDAEVKIDSTLDAVDENGNLMAKELKGLAVIGKLYRDRFKKYIHVLGEFLEHRRNDGNNYPV